MQPEENKWLVVCQPLQPPAIDPHLEELNAVVRSAECLRHFVLSTEYWLSPNGRLRHWLKINVFIGIGLSIPSAFVMPVVSVFLLELDGWLSSLLSIAWKLVLLSVLIFVVVCVLQHRHKHFPSSSKGSPRRRKLKPACFE